MLKHGSGRKKSSKGGKRTFEGPDKFVHCLFFARAVGDARVVLKDNKINCLKCPSTMDFDGHS